jgi:hypothetical protein
MRPLVRYAIVGFAAMVGAMTLAVASDSDPVVGTWQLNAAKSTFTNAPAVKSQTRTYTQSGPSISLVMKTVGADGKEATLQTTYQLDGKDYPVTGAPGYDSISGKQVNPRTASFVLKKGGTVVGTTTRTVSKDGKHMTSKMSATSEKGEKMESVMVLDKQ